MEIGSLADWISGIGSLLAVIVVIIQIYLDKKIRDNEKEEERLLLLASKLVEIQNNMFLLVTLLENDDEKSDDELFDRYLFGEKLNLIITQTGTTMNLIARLKNKKSKETLTKNTNEVLDTLKLIVLAGNKKTNHIPINVSILSIITKLSENQNLIYQELLD